jgi:hypothetical protein
MVDEDFASQRVELQDLHSPQGCVANPPPPGQPRRPGSFPESVSLSLSRRCCEFSADLPPVCGILGLLLHDPLSTQTSAAGTELYAGTSWLVLRR